jgi:hypothetical protein
VFGSFLGPWTYREQWPTRPLPTLRRCWCSSAHGTALAEDERLGSAVVFGRGWQFFASGVSVLKGSFTTRLTTPVRRRRPAARRPHLMPSWGAQRHLI